MNTTTTNTTTEPLRPTAPPFPARTFRIWELTEVYRALGLLARDAERAAVADLLIFRPAEESQNPQQQAA